MQRCPPRPCGVRRIIPDAEYPRDWPGDAALADARRRQWPVGGWPAVLAAWRWKLHARAVRLWCLWCLLFLFCACCACCSCSCQLFLFRSCHPTVPDSPTNIRPSLPLPLSLPQYMLRYYCYTHSCYTTQICFYRLQLSARWIHIHSPTVPEMNLTLVEFYPRLPGTKSTKTPTGCSSKWPNLANYKVC